MDDRTPPDEPGPDGPRPAPGGHAVMLVTLADEFTMTTADALDLCERLGIPADSSASELDPAGAAAFRAGAADPDAVPPVPEPTDASSWALPAGGSPGAAPGADATGGTGAFSAWVAGSAASPAAPGAGAPPSAGPAGVAGVGPAGVGPGGAGPGFGPPGFGPAGFGPAGFGPAGAGPGFGPAFGPGAPGGAGVPGAAVPVDPLAVVAMVLAFLPLIGIFFGFFGIVFLIPAAICASVAKKRIAANPWQHGGAKLAKAAEITAVACWLAGIGIGLLLSTGTIKKAPTEVASDLVTGKDSTPFFDLEPGMCIETSITTSSGPEAVRSVPVVPCGEPHDGEVFFTTTLPAGAHPSEASVRETVLTSCGPPFFAYTGSDPATTKLDAGFFYPDERTWKAGQHTLVCFAYPVDGSRVTGSLKGSAR